MRQDEHIDLGQALRVDRVELDDGEAFGERGQQRGALRAIVDDRRHVDGSVPFERHARNDGDTRPVVCGARRV